MTGKQYLRRQNVGIFGKRHANLMGLTGNLQAGYTRVFAKVRIACLLLDTCSPKLRSA